VQQDNDQLQIKFAKLH